VPAQAAFYLLVTTDCSDLYGLLYKDQEQTQMVDERICAFVFRLHSVVKRFIKHT